MFRILIRNAASNWMGYVAQAAVTFFLTPFVLHSLGNARYGIWSLVMGLIGYYGFLDLGLRSGIGQYMTRHLAKRDFIQMNRTASTAFVALSTCGVLTVLLSMILSWLTPILFAIPTNAIQETRWAILVIGLSVAVQFSFHPFSAVYLATQRYDIANAVGVGTRLLTAVATYVVLSLGYGLVALSVVNAGGNVLGYAIRWRLAYRILPELVVSPRLASWQGLGAITTYSIWSVLNRGANQLISYSSAIIIGLFMPVTAIAPYALAVGLAGQLRGAIGPVARVFYPAITHLDAREDSTGLRNIYLTGSRMLMLISVSGGTIAATWAADFFRLWLGATFFEDTSHTSVSVIFLILLPGVFFTTGQKVGCQVFHGTRQLRQLSLLNVCEAATSIFLSISLIRPFGLIGVAVGYLISALLFEGVVHPVVVCRLLCIPARTYLSQVYFQVFTVGAMLAGLTFLIRYATLSPNTWGQLVRCAFAASLAAIILIVVFGFNRSERHRFVLKPLMRARRCVRFV